MNRRKFLKTSALAGALTMASPVFVSLEGCDAATLKSYLNTVLDSAEKILGLSSSTDSWYTELTNAIAALESTETNWNGNTAVAAIISALDTLEAVLAVIPITATFSPLIDLLVTVIETILTTFVSTTQQTAVPKAIHLANLHRGRVLLKKPHFLQSEVGAYKSQWNEIVNANPALAKAKL